MSIWQVWRHPDRLKTRDWAKMRRMLGSSQTRNIMKRFRNFITAALLCLASQERDRFQIVPLKRMSRRRSGIPFGEHVSPAKPSRRTREGIVLRGGSRSCSSQWTGGSQRRMTVGATHWRPPPARQERVLVSSIHQHDAPLADLTAQRILEQRGITDVVDLKFQSIVQRVAKAVPMSGAATAHRHGSGGGTHRVERRYPFPTNPSTMGSTRNAFAIDALKASSIPSPSAEFLER